MTWAERIAAPFWRITGWIFGYRRPPRVTLDGKPMRCIASDTTGAATFSTDTGGLVLSFGAPHRRVYRGPQFYEDATGP